MRRDASSAEGFDHKLESLEKWTCVDSEVRCLEGGREGSPRHLKYFGVLQISAFCGGFFSEQPLEGSALDLCCCNRKGAHCTLKSPKPFPFKPLIY